MPVRFSQVGLARFFGERPTLECRATQEAVARPYMALRPANCALPRCPQTDIQGRNRRYSAVFRRMCSHSAQYASTLLRPLRPFSLQVTPLDDCAYCLFPNRPVNRKHGEIGGDGFRGIRCGDVA